MRRILFLLIFISISAFCFALNSANITIISDLSIFEEHKQYSMQVGSYRLVENAGQVYFGLHSIGFNLSLEQYLDFTRIIITGISARDIPLYLERIRNLGIREVIIRVDTVRQEQETEGSE